MWLGGYRTHYWYHTGYQITSRVKNIAVHIIYIHEQFDIHKTSPDNISTYIQPDYMDTNPISGIFLELNFCCICGVRFYPLINMIIFLSLISIFTPWLGPHYQTLVVITTLPWSFSVINLSKSFTLSCLYFILLLSIRKGRNGTFIFSSFSFPMKLCKLIIYILKLKLSKDKITRKPQPLAHYLFSMI